MEKKQPPRRRRHPAASQAQHSLTRETVAIVLAGGRGSRLAQLTDRRAKPAVTFGGKFRIIDFTLSNCVNSGIRRIGVCAQYRAQSLIRHMQRGWSFLDGRFGELIEMLPAEQGATDDWYQGTADAVHQSREFLRHHRARHVLVVAGDHIYKMDYGRLIEDHMASGAPMTVACFEVSVEEAANALGVVVVDRSGRITGFQEKPARPATIPGKPGRVLGSMGIYVAEADFLYEQLGIDAADAGSSHDFGKDIIPRLVAAGIPVHAHDFELSCVRTGAGRPYWRDVGTVDAFWESNLELTYPVPELDLYDREWPIWTYQYQLPPAKFLFEGPGRNGIAYDSLVSGGSIVSGSVIRRSLLSVNVHVHSYCTIESSVILPSVDIARHCLIRRAIIDKDCRLPEGFTVGVDPAEDRRRFHVTDKGVTLVTPGMLEA
jgi:glucose-1-phosphate adenylyltransferase